MRDSGRKPRFERGGCPQCGDAVYDLIFQNLMSVNLMYAVFSDGGKQYRVEEGQELDIDFRDVKKGSTLKFDKILAVGPGEKFQIGKPDVPKRERHHRGFGFGVWRQTGCASFAVVSTAS